MNSSTHNDNNNNKIDDVTVIPQVEREKRKASRAEERRLSRTTYNKEKEEMSTNEETRRDSVDQNGEPKRRVSLYSMFNKVPSKPNTDLTDFDKAVDSPLLSNRRSSGNNVFPSQLRRVSQDGVALLEKKETNDSINQNAGKTGTNSSINQTAGTKTTNGSINQNTGKTTRNGSVNENTGKPINRRTSGSSVKERMAAFQKS